MQYKGSNKTEDEDTQQHSSKAKKEATLSPQNIHGRQKNYKQYLSIETKKKVFPVFLYSVYTENLLLFPRTIFEL